MLIDPFWSIQSLQLPLLPKTPRDYGLLTIIKFDSKDREIFAIYVGWLLMKECFTWLAIVFRTSPDTRLPKSHACGQGPCILGVYKVEYTPGEGGE